LAEQARDDEAGLPALSHTYRQAAVEVGRLADSIAAGACPGERVVVAVANGYRSLLMCVAASRAGCVPVPIDPEIGLSAAEHLIAGCAPALVIRSDNDLPRRRGLPAARSADPDDVAVLFHTSGAEPEGVGLTHRALTGMIRGVGLPRWVRSDEAVLSLPVAHAYGFVAHLGLAAVGVPAFVIPRFRPVEVLDALEQRRASAFLGFPVMYRLLLEAGADGRDLSCVRVWVSGGDVMPAGLARTFQQMGASFSVPFLGGFGEALFAEARGMADPGGAAAVKVRPPLVGRLADVGVRLPLPGWERARGRE
ncbi:MAG: AMP-binding protein, partial [Acidimicrobiales bacterium]